jgi:hypothetical protein
MAQTGSRGIALSLLRGSAAGSLQYLSNAEIAPQQHKPSGAMSLACHNRQTDQLGNQLWTPDFWRVFDTPEGIRRAGSSVLVLETVRHHAAALSKFDHDLLVEPDVHFRRAIEFALVSEFLRQLLAGAKAAVQLEQLHQIDDRLFPVSEALSL